MTLFRFRGSTATCVAAETLSFVDAGGVVYPLSLSTTEADLVDASTAAWLAGTTGRGLPPTSFVEDQVVGLPGSQLRTVRTGVREVSIPLMLVGSSLADLVVKQRTFARAFDSSRGPAKLRSVTAAGTRELSVRYAGGMELTETHPDRAGAFVARMVAVFRAFDPYWYGGVQTQTFIYDSNSQGFFPILPLLLGVATSFAYGTVNNDGDVESWPTWTVQGPFSGLAIRNITTSESIALPSLTLGAGSSITISTSPTDKTLVGFPNYTNHFSSLAYGSTLWAFTQGSNDIRLELGTPGEGTAVVLSWQKRYLTS